MDEDTKAVVKIVDDLETSLAAQVSDVFADRHVAAPEGEASDEVEEALFDDLGKMSRRVIIELARRYNVTADELGAVARTRKQINTDIQAIFTSLGKSPDYDGDEAFWLFIEDLRAQGHISEADELTSLGHEYEAASEWE